MSSAAPVIPVPIAGPSLIGRKTLPRQRTEEGRKPAATADRGPLRRIFWIVFIWLLAVVAWKAPAQAPESVIGATLVIVASMLPAYLWSIGKVRGLPLFPACALTCTWTFGLPLVSEHPIVSLFPGSNQLIGAVSIAEFALIGTLFWYLTARAPARVPAVCWMMDEEAGRLTMLFALGACAAWSVVSIAAWFVFSPGLDSIIRAMMLAAEAVSCFVLSYFWGRGRLPAGHKAVFLVLFGILVLSILPSLLMIYAMSLFAISAMAYLVASKRLPWRLCLVAICVFGFLHLGKGEMREKYWNEDDVRKPVAPWEYPAFYAEWAQESFAIAKRPSSDDDAPADLLDRASLMHWLLYFEATTPGAFPYLAGESYSLIPRLFVPRFLDPDKPHGNEGSNILAMRYGIQTREDTDLTTIAFGLISEAYANFGYWGIAMVAAILGAGYGKAAQWARGMPLLSFRAFFAILMASLAIQAELCATSYATFLFQSMAVLLAFSVAFMRRRPLQNAQVSCLD